MAKGQVLPHEIKPTPKYVWFSDGEYHNPQTDPIFLYVQEYFKNEGGWYNCYDWEWIKDKYGKEITLLKIHKRNVELDNYLHKNNYRIFFSDYIGKENEL